MRRGEAKNNDGKGLTVQIKVASHVVHRIRELLFEATAVKPKSSTQRCVDGPTTKATTQTAT